MVSVSAGPFLTKPRNFTHTHAGGLDSGTVSGEKLWCLTRVFASCRGCMAWLPISFAWGNFSVLAIGVWAVAQRDSIDAMLLVRHRTDPPPCRIQT